MDDNLIVRELSTVTFGTVAQWIVSICVLIGVLVAFTIKLYKAFTKYRNLKEENEKQIGLIEKHNEALQEIDKSLHNITEALAEQKEVNKKHIRHDIVQICDEALVNGYITAGKYRFLSEIYEEYTTVFHGNSYASGLYEKVQDLPVKGSLDE